MRNLIGIVVGVTKYRDNSHIVRVYTQDGIISILVNNIKKNKSYFDFLNVLDIQTYESKGDIFRLKSVGFYLKENTSIEKQHFKLFLAEVLSQISNKDIYNEHYFLYILKKLENINKEEITFFVVDMLLGITEFLGFYPEKNIDNKHFFDLKEGVFCNDKPFHKYYIPNKYINLWSKYISNDILNISEKEFCIVLKSILTYYQLHIDNFKLPYSYNLILGVM